MASLKRILNEDDSNRSFSPSNNDPAGRREPPSDEFGWLPSPPLPGSDMDDFLHETPVLNDAAWDDLCRSILQPTYGDSQLDLALSGIQATDVEREIETWTALNLPAVLPSDLTFSQLPLESPSTNSKTIESDELYRVGIKLQGDMSVLDSKLAANNTSLSDTHSHGEYSQAFVIRRSPSKQIFLNFQDGSEFGLMSKQTTEALLELFDRPFIRFEARASKVALREVIARASNAKSGIVRTNINIYGPKSSGSIVGSHLSNHNAYLQRPDNLGITVIYENPHELKFPGFQPNLEVNLPRDPNESKGSISTNPEELRSAIGNMYNSLKRGTALDKIVGGRGLITELLPHQQEALAFMEQRETGECPVEFLLWQPIESDGQTWYEHLVTKAKSHIRHEEKGGGILADEMGMGKSLSILALILRTMENGHRWVEARERGDPATRSVTASRATLVVVPSALLVNSWLNEIEKHIDGSLSVIKYHGQGRETDIATIANADIVVTTYNTLAVEFAKKGSRLHKIGWYRLVLDEGHIIRRQATTFYRTIYELKANSRWCLTGTPIQNRLEDIGTLFTFLRARPFDSLAMFRRYIVTPFYESNAKRELACERLTLLIDSICLRRTKDLLNLEGQENCIREIEFSPAERKQYESTKTTMIRKIHERVGEMVRKDMFGMFQAQLQLRILCNHGTYQHHFTWARMHNILDEREDALCNAGWDSDIKCSSCRQSMPILGSNVAFRKYIENCAHVLCSECLNETEERNEISYSSSTNTPQHCPLCVASRAMQDSSAMRIAPGELPGEGDGYFKQDGHSSKMAALIEDVQKDVWTTKSIIFSCWTRTLNLIAKHLGKADIPFQRIDGECVLLKRQQILDSFANNAKSRVLIMTTGTGAFGLNLTAANRVFIVEPQWNPSVENQAIARAIRLGQDQKVLVTRYVVKSTIEQEMRTQQERKLRLAEIGFD